MLGDPVIGQGVVGDAARGPDPPKSAPAASHVRGSSLLLAGRVVAVAVDFLAHVLVVRYLAKEAFGAYSFALEMAILLSTAMLLGLPETLARQVPIYRERREAGKLIGAVAGSVVTVGAAGVACVFVVLALPGPIASLLGSPETAALLAILIFVVPLEAVNLVLQALYAAEGRVRLIFMRQYVLVPGIRFTVVILLVSAGLSVTFLAIGYVLASLLGLLLYGGGLLGRLRSVRDDLRPRVEVPARELFAFALPVFVSSLVMLTLLGLGTVTVGLVQGPAEVAVLQAVERPARLNFLVYTVFSVLYVPTSAALFARDDVSGLREAYRASALWMVVLGLPGLLLTTVFAPVFVSGVFGERYASSAPALILLAAAYFSFAGAGPSSQTLKVLRRLRLNLIVDALALALGAVLIVVLVPSAGATGAALGTLGGVMARNLVLTVLLHRVIGGPLLGGDYVRLVGGIAVLLAVLSALQLVVEIGLATAVALSAAAALGTLFAARRMLDVGGMFPELQRLPLPGFLRH